MIIDGPRFAQLEELTFNVSFASTFLWVLLVALVLYIALWVNICIALWRLTKPAPTVRRRAAL